MAMAKPKPLGRGALSSRRALALLILVGAIASYIDIDKVLRAVRQADNYNINIYVTRGIHSFKEDQPFAPIKNETGGWILPVTRFSHHILTLVENYNLSFHDDHWSVDLTIQSNPQIKFQL